MADLLDLTELTCAGRRPQPWLFFTFEKTVCWFVICNRCSPNPSCKSVVSSLRGFESWSSNLGESLKQKDHCGKEQCELMSFTVTLPNRKELKSQGAASKV